VTTVLKVHAVFEKHGKWYVGYVPEVRGVNAQERTLKAARSSLMMALHELAAMHPQPVSGVDRTVEEMELILDGAAKRSAAT